jgi:hypothetical protein
MTATEVKAVFKKLWEAKFIIAGTMILTGVLDLIGITTHNIGLGFVLGFLFLFIYGIVVIAKQFKKSKSNKGGI